MQTQAEVCLSAKYAKGLDLIEFAPINSNLLSRRDTYLPRRGNKRETSVVRNCVFYNLPRFVVETRGRI